MNDITPFLGLVGSVLVAMLALTGAVYAARSGGRASPYAALEGRVMNLERQHDEDAILHEQDRTTIASLERRVSAVIADRDDVVGYLVVFREWVAMGASPPAPKVPLHLRDVIPDWTPDDADRTTDVHVSRLPQPDQRAAEPAGP